jgi:penicillin-binding protein 2
MFEYSDTSSRKTAFFVLVGIVFIVFLFRLIQLQVLYQDEYGKKSEENSIRQIGREPIRGLMFDRNGILLVDNQPAYSATITPSEFRLSNLEYFSGIVHLEPQYVKETIDKGKNYNRFAPIRVKREIDFPMLSAIEENKNKLLGVDYQVESKRFYPTNAKAAHLFGYIKEISDQQLAEMGKEYRPGDNIGATGIEAAYERYLRGQKGIELITVNALGQMLGNFNDGKSNIPVKEGSELHLAIDAHVQALAESLLADKRGSLVALDPNDGGVIALVSKPDYDLTSFGAVTTTETWNALNSDDGKPLFNRATLNQYELACKLYRLIPVWQ